MPFYQPSLFRIRRHKVPSVLHINQESRKEALKHYKLHFGAPSHAQRVYFNFSLDTLFIDSSFNRGVEETEEVLYTPKSKGRLREIQYEYENLRYLAVSLKWLEDDFYTRLAKFDNLQVLTLHSNDWIRKYHQLIGTTDPKSKYRKDVSKKFASFRASNKPVFEILEIENFESVFDCKVPY